MARGRFEKGNQAAKGKGSSRPSKGTGIIWPKGLQERYGISVPTRWRWEASGKLPPRDVFIGGRAVGWKPETIERAEAGSAAV